MKKQKEKVVDPKKVKKHKREKDNKTKKGR